MIAALAAAARSQLKAGMLGLVLWPLLGSLLLWLVLTLIFWSSALRALEHLSAYAPIHQFLLSNGIAWIANSLVLLALLLLLPTVVVATSLFITSVIAMPIMVARVAAADYPQLERRRGGSALGGIVNALVALLVYLVLWIVVLPLWLLLPFAAVIPIALNGYLNDRVFRFDALAEHASRDEYREILRRRGTPLFGLGIVAALIQLIPFVNLVSPVYSGLSFIHFGLAELAALRAERGLRPV